MSDLLSRITIRSGQCRGQPCIRGMRIRVADILELLAGDMTIDDILADYPYLERDDVRAALAYAAQELKHPIVTRAHGDQRDAAASKLEQQVFSDWNTKKDDEAFRDL